MRIVLPFLHLDEIVFTPLPMLRLKQALVRQGVCAPHDVIIKEYKRDDSLQAMLDEIIALKPDVVGMSCYTWSFVACERLSAAIKAMLPEITIVWGGPHTSELPEKFLATYPLSVDYIITWYAEGSFVELIRAIDCNITTPIPGVFTRDGGEKATEYLPLASLGYPYEYVADMVGNVNERVFLVETYRNCPFSCSYCLWGQAAKHLDAITAEQMLTYTYRAVDDGMRIAMFADAGLGIVRNPDRTSRDKQVFRKFADDRILQRKGVQMRAYHFWQTMDDETLDIFAELIDQGVMGQIDLGIQTFNEDVLHDLQRPTNYERFFGVVAKLHKRHIRFSLDLILGLPGDNLAGFKESLRKVISCKPDRTQSFPLSVLPGSAYDLRRDELGIRTIRGSYRDDAETVIATNSFSYTDMLEALQIEAWMFLYTAEGLFIHSLGALADEKSVDPLTQLEDMRSHADHMPALSELVNIYRRHLYDSRSDGRYKLEARLMENFAEVYKELWLYFGRVNASFEVMEILRNELLAFPKFKHTAQTLDGVDGIVYTDGVLVQFGGKQYEWHQDPVIGAVVRNRNHYRWLNTSEAQRRADVMPQNAGAYD